MSVQSTSVVPEPAVAWASRSARPQTCTLPLGTRQCCTTACGCRGLHREAPNRVRRELVWNK
eukprot:scaffold4125_cov333-Prasinococcus_capsulatus_cf.AAC.3